MHFRFASIVSYRGYCQPHFTSFVSDFLLLVNFTSNRKFYNKLSFSGAITFQQNYENRMRILLATFTVCALHDGLVMN